MLRASAAMTTDRGAVGSGAREHQPEQELGVGQDEGEQPGCDDARARERQKHVPERLEPAAAVEQSGLLDLARNAAEEHGQDQHRERQRQDRVDQDEGELGPEQAHCLNHEIERRHQRHGRNQPDMMIATKLTAWPRNRSRAKA